MKKFEKRMISLLLVLVMAVVFTGCGSSSDSADDSSDTETEAESSSGDVMYTIGVAVYDMTDPEMLIFFHYYNDYIAESFPVEFVMSGDLDTIEDEVEFVETMAEDGADGIISFYESDLEAVVAACEENELYYVLGSSSISDEEFDSVKDNEWFLGVIGMDDEEEYNAGYDMAGSFIDQDCTSFLITSGGAGEAANYMHYTRVIGMLTALQEAFGLTYSAEIEDLAQTTELTTVDTGSDEVTIVISPGYVQMDEGYSNFTTALEDGDYDAILSAQGLTSVLDELEDEISTSALLTLVGVVDCFSEENYQAFETTDSNGNSLLNYVKGKYGSMVAPAFVAMFNALSDHMDLVKPDGEAFRLYQSYWTADSEEEYAELYGYTQSIYENAYSSQDLMDLLGSYNEDATYEAFAEMTAASDVESVMARMEAE